MNLPASVFPARTLLQHILVVPIVAGLFLPMRASFARVVESAPVAVTVYPDRAAVTRQASFEVPAGESIVELTGLPMALEEASLTATGRGSVPVTILDVTSRVEHTQQTAHPQFRELEEEKLRLGRQLKTIEEGLRLLEAEAGSLKAAEAAVTQPVTGSAPRPNLKDISELLPYLSAQRKRLSDETSALQSQADPLKERLLVVDRQIAELRGMETRAHRVVAVRLKADNAGRFDLHVAYQVPGAAWLPRYDARLRGATREIELTYFGSVRNGTGENWSDVALTLSTAKPARGGSAPEPQPWIVDWARPVFQRIGASEEAAAMQPFSVTQKNEPIGAVGFGSVELGAAPPAAAIEARRQVVSQVDNALTSATFRVDGRFSLPSDTTVKKVTVAQTRLPATLLYRTTPKLSEAAFLASKANNATDFPLLAGTVSVYLDDAFVATSRLASVMPGETFDLALGVDEGISVKRRLVNRFTEDTGLTGKGRRVTYEVLISLANNKKTSERIEVREAVPVSRNEKIVVACIAPNEREIGAAGSDKPVVRDAEGRLTWRLELNPGEKRDLTLRFSVDHPANLPVTGLD